MTLQEMLALIVKLAGTDPRFKVLVEALTEKCSDCGGKGTFVDRWGKEGCPTCGGSGHGACGTSIHPGSGRALRSWEDEPQGALRGALYMAGYKADLWANESWDAPLKRIFLPLYDVEAVEVVLEALKGTTHAAE